MNFMISFLGWFLWNWAEFSITKEKGDNFGCLNAATKAVMDESALSDTMRMSLISKFTDAFKKPTTLREYAATHYETWVGSFATIFLLLYIGYKKLSIDPIAPLFGLSDVSGWSEFYLIACGATWDAFIFGFKRVKAFFDRK